MVEVLSIVRFDDANRVKYLDKSFRVFHELYPQCRHVVVDGSPQDLGQGRYYSELGCEVWFVPESYGRRLQFGAKLMRSAYFVFLPDDYTWIFQFPVERAMQEALRFSIDEIKLSPRGLKWYSSITTVPEKWYVGNKLRRSDVDYGKNPGTLKAYLIRFWELLSAGERLSPCGQLMVSSRRFLRAFNEMFSLGCNILSTSFLLEVIGRIRLVSSIVSAGDFEKAAYRGLLTRSYRTAYYRFWTPAFHFLDPLVEGASQHHKLADMLIPENYEVYNRLFHTELTSGS
jgi:hypothetical protein